MFDLPGEAVEQVFVIRLHASGLFRIAPDRLLKVRQNPLLGGQPLTEQRIGGADLRQNRRSQQRVAPRIEFVELRGRERHHEDAEQHRL